MTLNPALRQFFWDTITIEPYVSASVTQASTYGTAVSHRAQLVPYVERVIDKSGREVRSQSRVVIADRRQIDPRSRITLPSGWEPNQPPILAVRPLKFMDLDCTEILL